MRAFRTPYRGYNVLDKWDTVSWNDQTREAVHDRLTNIPDRRFFTQHEWETLEAVCERILPQPERREPVPIVPFIDKGLAENSTSGTQLAALPKLHECWRRLVAGIDAEAEGQYGHPFKRIDITSQTKVLRRIGDGDVMTEAWQGLPPQTVFRKILLKEVVGIYYAHPDAWSEIGFGGPAAPRGYLRLAPDRRDPWEAEETGDLPVNEADFS